VTYGINSFYQKKIVKAPLHYSHIAEEEV